MGILRDIGESINQEQTKSDGKSPMVYKKDSKYFEDLNGKEISEDEVGNRTIISFEK
ncbi:hypothetical protein [Winogradskyella sp.]|uniref:hypothetical protein n=1 Tax=Winogradskyella sp. TaxID=1883156 RepID=UPI001B188FE6|nr:hypothetical protein [Winogradskyella sp.]MBO6881453.1 hypothetical protein [Winogradskyella sp.]